MVTKRDQRRFKEDHQSSGNSEVTTKKPKSKSQKEKKEKKGKQIKIEPVAIFDQFYKPLSFTKLLNARKHLILDIDTEKISYLVVKKQGSDVQVIKCGIQNLASNEIERLQSLRIALTNLRSRFYKSGMKVIVSFSSADINIRQIILPKTKKKSDLEKAISFKNQDELSNFNGNFIWRYKINNEFEEDGIKKLNVLVTIVPGRIVKSYIDILDAIKLKPEKLIPRPLAIAATYSKMVPKTQNDLVAVVSTDFTELCYLDFGRFQFFRKVAIGTSNIIGTTNEDNSVDFKAKLKKLSSTKDDKNNGDLSSKIRANLFQKIKDSKSNENPFIKMFLSEIKRSIEFLNNTYSQKIDRIFLTGSGIKIPELISYLKEQLDIPVVLLRPQFSLSEKDPNRYTDYFAVLGTALHLEKDVDFIPKQYKDVQIFKSLNILLILLFFITATALFYFNSYNQKEFKQNQKILEQQMDQYNLLNPIENEYNQRVLEIGKLQKEKQQLLAHVKEPPQLLEVMHLVSKEIPPEIIINALQFGNFKTEKYTVKKGKETQPEYTYTVTLIGQVKSEYLMGDVILINFINHLTDLKYFKRIRLKNKTKELDRELFEFELNLFI